MPRPAIKKISRTTLTQEEIIRYISGWRPSPTDCRTPTKILYMTTPIDPAKYVRKYTIDSGSTSAGVPINTRIFGARNIPKTVSTAPATSPNATVVWIAFFRQSLFLAP